ncbi:MAG: dihydroneopterin aldolase [Bacteroidales bacterium]|nr:dihydroneopterin aldolase [Bacteroidales bacterium]
MGIIKIEEMEFFAYHGCFREEQITGNKFLIDVIIETDTYESEISDDLSKTINYQEVYKLIKNEMNTKSKLLENIAYRIIHSIKSKFPSVQNIELSISKINPPLGGKVGKVTYISKK